MTVSAAAPALTVRLGALAALPPVAPKETVAVAAWFRTNPPAPVHVKFVAVPIFNTVVAARVLLSTMVPAPKAIDRVLVLAEEKEPAVNVNPLRFMVPWVNVKVEFEATVRASAIVTVIPAPLTVAACKVRPTLVTVLVRPNTGEKLV